jgi:hypothetical protein
MDCMAIFSSSEPIHSIQRILVCIYTFITTLNYHNTKTPIENSCIVTCQPGGWSLTYLFNRQMLPQVVHSQILILLLV